MSGPFQDPILLNAFGSMLAAMETDLIKQGMSEKRAKIMVGSFLLTTGQSALIQAAQMPNVQIAREMPKETKQ